MLLTVVASFLSLLAFVGQVFVLIGSTKNTSIVRDINMFRFDLNLGNNTSLNGSTAEAVKFAHTNSRNITSDNSTMNDNSTIPILPDYTTVGIWSYCEGSYYGGIFYCSTPAIGWQFDNSTFALGPEFDGSKIDTSLNKILATAYIIAAITTFFAFVVGACSCSRSGLALIASALATIGLCTTAIAFVVNIILSRNIYFTALPFDEHITSSLTLGSWITLVIILLLCCAAFGFLAVCCACNFGRRSTEVNVNVSAKINA